MMLGPRTTATIQRVGLYVLLLLVPFSKASVEIAFGLLLIGWLADRIRPSTRSDTLWRDARLRLLGVGLIVYWVACALSIMVSGYPVLSLRALFSKWGEYLLLLVIATDVARRPGVARCGAQVVTWSVVAVVIEAVSQELFGRGLFRPTHAPLLHARMIGPYEIPSDLATYLMVVTPLLLIQAVTSAGRRRWALWILLGASLLCLVRTETVGAWIGLGVGLGFVSLRHPHLRRPGLIMLAAVALVASAYLARVGRLGGTFSMADIGRVDRWAMWQAAWGMIRARPILGHGLNTFMANYLGYWVGGERQPRYAHNCYLQVWAETGVVGLLSFVALLGLLFARLLAGLPRIRFDGEPALLLGLVAGLIAFAVHAAVDTNFYALRQAALFWTLSGMALGLRECRVSHGDET